MSDILEFIFQDFDHLVGTILLLAIFMDGIAGIIRSFRNTEKYSNNEEKEGF